jgi:squalene synthase HpnC
MHAAALRLSPPATPGMQAVMARAGAENFPVATRLLARADRRHLLAIYGFARLADELGDELEGDRLAALDWLEAELDRAYRGAARHPLLVRLQATLLERTLPRTAFVRLIDANRLDQRVSRYRTWAQLQSYCRLSANPVGELVLGVFGLATPARIALSDEVCTALQLIEHLQDVGEDLQRGRIYLPEEDLVRFGCTHEQLTDQGEDFARTAQGLRETIAFECTRARGLLAGGVPLVAGCAGRPKLALAAFVAGGRAALEQIERARTPVLFGVAPAGRVRLARAFARVLAESRA